MSRARNKCGYSFRQSPRELAPAWSRVSFYQRALGGELFRLVGDEPYPVGEDWRESLCRKLEVHGKERTAAKFALRGLQEAGLLVISGGFATVLFSPAQQDRTETTAAPQQERTENAPGTQPERDSTQDAEIVQITSRRIDIDLEKKRDGERARDLSENGESENDTLPTRATPLLALSVFDEYRAVSFDKKIAPESAGPDQKLRIAQRILDHARIKGLELKPACAAFVTQAFANVAVAGGSVVLELERCTPGVSKVRGKPWEQPKPPVNVIALRAAIGYGPLAEGE